MYNGNHHQHGEIDMFTKDNTSSFSSSELAAMNAALEALFESGAFDKNDSDDVKNAQDLISNNAAHGDFALGALTRSD